MFQPDLKKRRPLRDCIVNVVIVISRPDNRLVWQYLSSLNKKSSRPISGNLCDWSGYPHAPHSSQGTCIPLTLVRVSTYPWLQSGYLHTTDTSQGIPIPQTHVRAPAYPRHWSGHLHTSDTDQGARIPLTLVRAPAYPWHWSWLRSKPH